MARDKNRRRGLLPRGLNQRAQEQGAESLPPGDLETPPRQSALDMPAEAQTHPTIFPGDTTPREWQNPCVFSCVPWQFRPVDIYGELEITVVQQE